MEIGQVKSAIWSIIISSTDLSQLSKRIKLETSSAAFPLFWKKKINPESNSADQKEILGLLVLFFNLRVERCKLYKWSLCLSSNF